MVVVYQILGNCVAHVPCNDHQAVFLIGVDSRLIYHKNMDWVSRGVARILEKGVLIEVRKAPAY